MKNLRMSRRVVTVVAAALLVGLALPLALPASSQVPTLSLRPSVIPQKLPADGGAYQAIFVQLASASGNIVEAPQDYSVFITSSNQTVGTALSPLTIAAGQAYGVAIFKTTTTAGTTSITVSGNGLSPVSIAVSTYVATNSPSRLQVFVAPAPLVADGTSSCLMFVQLQDVNGTPSRTSGALTILMTSSNPGVLNVQPSLTIPGGATYASSQLTAGTQVGNTTITAQLNGFQSAATTLRSIYLPLSLALTNDASGPLTSGGSVSFAVVATSSGIPVSGAKANWTLSSKADSFNGTLTTDTTGTSRITVRLAEGGNLTATAIVSASGYSPKSISQTVPVKALLLAVQLIPASLDVNLSQASGVNALVTSSGRPVAGASVSWSASPGSMSPTLSSTDASGLATSTFTGTANGNATVTATASLTGYSSGTGSVVLIVGPASGGTSSHGFLPFSTTYLVAIVAVVVLVLLVVFRRRLPLRGKAKEPEEEEAEGEDEELSSETAVKTMPSIIGRGPSIAK